MGEDRALVLGHADRAVERRGTVAVKVHERVHAVWIEGDEASARPQHPMHLPGAARGVRQVVDDAAEQYAVKACIGKRQVLDVAFEELNVRVLPSGELDQLRADIEPAAAASMP